MENRALAEEMIISNAAYYEVTPEKVKQMSDEEILDILVTRIGVYTSGGKLIGKSKVTDLHAGMYVKEAYEDGRLLKVTGDTYEDPIDWVIVTEAGDYSPLLLTNGNEESEE